MPTLQDGRFKVIVTGATGGITASAQSALDNAESAAALAQLGADSAAAAGNYYSTKAEGEAATTEGQFFSYSDGMGGLVYAERTADGAGDDGGNSTVIANAATTSELNQALANVSGKIALGQLNRIMSKLNGQEADANIVIVTDSTGDATNEWPYLLFNGDLKTSYPEWTIRIRYWSGSAYGAATTLQTGTGPRTLTVFVGAVAGSAANYFAVDRFSDGVIAPNPDVVIVSYGHNGDITGGPGSYTIKSLRQLSFFSGLADRLAKDLPQVPVVAIGQNPSTNDTGSNAPGTDDGFMTTRLKVLRPFYARHGWGYIDVHGAFQKSETPLAGLLVDDVHPNVEGSQLWADTVFNVMQASDGAQGTGQLADGKLLRSWGNLAQFSQWTKSNVALSKATGATDYETEGHSVELTATNTASASSITIRAISSDDIPLVAGRYVTFAVWMKVPTANTGNSGRLDIDDGISPFTAFSGPQEGDSKFQLFSATHYVDPLATYVDLTIYAVDGAATPASVIRVDRASIALGQEAVDPDRPFELSARRIFVAGGNANGIGYLYNSAATNAGLRFYPNETSALTEWTSDFRADGFAVKQTGDSNPRYEVAQFGGLRMGSGAAPTDMGIDRQLGGVMRFSGADIYPDGNGTRFLGAANTQWRAAFLKDGLYVNNTLVVQGQQAAIANDASGAANQATVNAILAALRAHGLIAT